MEHFTPSDSFSGGLLIGAAAVLLLACNGRIAGVSGILGGVLEARSDDIVWRLMFVGGLILGALGFQTLGGSLAAVKIEAGWPVVILGGLLVGFGTHRGRGCTSGHGVCGNAQLSKRSMIATLTFMAAGFATVFVLRHLIGA
ncbi:MAG: YeeE/YedE family protein [Alphaproteobacteria bacterium]|nr:YeeE/YedE family protein [Alphaproteobacteria bacterium]